MSAALASAGRGWVRVPVLSKTTASHLGQPLQRLARMEDEPAAEERPGGDHLHRRDGEAERAGTGDDQHRDRDEQRLLPAGPEREPADERRERRSMHDRHVEPRGAVGEAHVGRALLDGALEQAVDLVEERAGAGGLARGCEARRSD